MSGRVLEKGCGVMRMRMDVTEGQDAGDGAVSLSEERKVVRYGYNSGVDSLGSRTAFYSSVSVMVGC